MKRILLAVLIITLVGVTHTYGMNSSGMGGHGGGMGDSMGGSGMGSAMGTGSSGDMGGSGTGHGMGGAMGTGSSGSMGDQHPGPQDCKGDDPLVRNGEFRILAGLEREVAKDFTDGFQYYMEWMSDYDVYEKSLGDAPKKVEYRHVLTVRLTKMLMNQNLRLSVFTYYSPSDQDAYIRRQTTQLQKR